MSGISGSNPLAKNYTAFSLFRFALPSIGMMLFMGFYTLADTLFVSRLVNADALSAINIVCPVINIIVGLGSMLASGGSARIARKLGEGQSQTARSEFTLLVIWTLGIGVIIAAAGSLLLDPLIQFLGGSEILFPYCRAYLLPLLLTAPASLLQILFQSFLITAGYPKLGFMLAVGAGLANIALDYLLIAGLGMGIAGSALGTGMGYCISAGLGLYWFSRRKGTLYFVRPEWKLAAIGESCGNGASEMVSQMSSAVTTFFFNAAMMRLAGETGVAAVTIMIYSQFILSTLIMGYAMGCAPILSYNYGAGESLRLKRLIQTVFRFVTGVSIILFLTYAVLSEMWIGFFVPVQSLIYPLAVSGFRIFSYSFLFSGFNISASAIFTALQDGRHSALISVSRTFVFILAGLIILPDWLGLTGVWLAVPAAELLTLILSLILMSTAGRHRLHKMPDSASPHNFTSEDCL